MRRYRMIICILIGFCNAGWCANRITTIATTGVMLNNRTSRQPMKNIPLSVYKAGNSGDILGSATTDTTGSFTLALFPKAGLILSSRDTLCIASPGFACTTLVRMFGAIFSIYNDTRDIFFRHILEPALVDGDTIVVKPGTGGSYFPGSFLFYPPIDSIIKPQWVTMDDCTGFCVKILPPPAAPSTECKFFKRIGDSLLYEFNFFVNTGTTTPIIEKTENRPAGLSSAPAVSVSVGSNALRVEWSQAEPQTVFMRLYSMNGAIAAQADAMPFSAGRHALRIPLQRQYPSGIYIFEIRGETFSTYRPVHCTASP